MLQFPRWQLKNPVVLCTEGEWLLRAPRTAKGEQRLTESLGGAEQRQ